MPVIRCLDDLKIVDGVTELYHSTDNNTAMLIKSEGFRDIVLTDWVYDCLRQNSYPVLPGVWLSVEPHWYQSITPNAKVTLGRAWDATLRITVREPLNARRCLILRTEKSLQFDDQGNVIRPLAHRCIFLAADYINSLTVKREIIRP